MNFNYVEQGIVGHLVPLEERKRLALTTFACIGSYPRKGTIMAKFNLSEHHANEVIRSLRKAGLKLSKQLDSLLYEDLRNN